MLLLLLLRSRIDVGSGTGPWVINPHARHEHMPELPRWRSSVSKLLLVLPQLLLQAPHHPPGLVGINL